MYDSDDLRLAAFRALRAWEEHSSQWGYEAEPWERHMDKLAEVMDWFTCSDGVDPDKLGEFRVSEEKRLAELHKAYEEGE